MPDSPTGTVSAAGLVRDYLAAMEARDLARAKAFLAPGFAMIFPGGRRFTALEELVDWARPRYRWVKKRYERFDAAPGGHGAADAAAADAAAADAAAADAAAVYCYGTLYGEWPDGRSFEGIRFIDRFMVAGGKLREQLVWNDLAETRAQEKENAG